MILGIGCDILQTGRMDGFLEKPGASKIFTEDERAYIVSRGTGASQSAAGIFAAKEAVLKALGSGIDCRLTDIEITHSERGRPQADISGGLAGRFPGVRLHISISHDGGCAMACAVAEEDA